jgi:hypothetical protein
MLFTIDLARVVDTFFDVYLSYTGGLFRTFRSLSMIIRRVGLFHSGLWLSPPNEVGWLTPAAKVKEIIFGGGKFLNVPLLGTRGGINYNPELALRQFGFPMKEKPIYLDTSPYFFHYSNAPTGIREDFIEAWSKIRIWYCS